MIQCNVQVWTVFVKFMKIGLLPCEATKATIRNYIICLHKLGELKHNGLGLYFVFASLKIH